MRFFAFLAILAVVSSQAVFPAGVGCASQPCQNGCTCQASCRDENDYVCVPPPGQPFVGKNCEWRAQVNCQADSTISIRVPEQAVAQYAQGIQSVMVQGCQDPLFLCNGNGNRQQSCGPVTQATNGYFDLTCPNRPSQLDAVSGEIVFSETFVFDRLSDIISMPRPIIKVDCAVRTEPAIGRITPDFRQENVVNQMIVWQPIFNFYKTAWQVTPAISATRVPNSRSVNYVIGERIHVQLTAGANMMSGVHSMSLGDCFVQPVQNGAAQSTPSIQIINNGVVVAGVEFPVTVAQATGQVGDNVPANSAGVAFSFQVFTFGAGLEFQLTCTAAIDGVSGRRRRSENEYEFSQMIVFIPIAADVDPDLPVVRIEPAEEIIDELIDDVKDIFDVLRNLSHSVVENMTNSEIEEMNAELAPRLGNIFNYYDDYENEEQLSEKTVLDVEIEEAEIIYRSIPNWAKFSSLALLFCITIMIIIILRQRRLMIMKKILDEREYQPFDNKSLLD